MQDENETHRLIREATTDGQAIAYALYGGLSLIADAIKHHTPEPADPSRPIPNHIRPTQKIRDIWAEC